MKIRAFKQSNPSTCGPASLKMILDYYGIKISEKKISKLAKTSRKEGTLAKNLIEVAEIFGLKGFIKDCASINDIKKNVQKSIPVIISWFSGWEGHYSVVYDIDKYNIYFNDPETAESVKMSLKIFKKLWFGIKRREIYHPWTKSIEDLHVRRIIVIYK